MNIISHRIIKITKLPFYSKSLLILFTHIYDSILCRALQKDERHRGIGRFVRLSGGLPACVFTCDIRGRGTYVTVLTSFRKVRKGVREGARVSPHLRPRLRVGPRSREWWWRVARREGAR